MRIENKKSGGAVIRAYSAKETLPKIIAWDGKDTGNAVVPEGIYKANFTAQDRTKIAMTGEHDLKVDITSPAVLLTISTNVFTIDPEAL